jgi:putative hydrolase of the HAD superfamily
VSATSSPIWAGAKALGFDLGETLLTYRDTPLSWAELYGAALRQVAAKLERDLDDEGVRVAEMILARHNTRLHPRTVEISGDVIFAEILRAWSWPASLRAQVMEFFFGFFQQRLVACPETVEVLRVLKSRGVRIGVLTDVPYGMPRHLVERDLAGAGLSELVDVWLTSVDVGHRKPAPEGFRALATALRVPIAELIYVGNEPKDIAGPKAAGARAVLISREKISKDLGQDATISSLSDLLKNE